MITNTSYPVIDMQETGRRIERQRRQAGLSVRELQNYFGFEYPQAIYKWQHGESLPTVDNLLALSLILGVPMEDLLVYNGHKSVYNDQKSVHYSQKLVCDGLKEPIVLAFVQTKASDEGETLRKEAGGHRVKFTERKNNEEVHFQGQAGQKGTQAA